MNNESDYLLNNESDYLIDNESGYLSDEELNSLIAQVEAGDIVTAPPDMLDNILHKLDESGKKPLQDNTVNPQTDNAIDIARPPRNIEPIKQKNEFVKYCIRVIGSVAAAIVLLLVVPEIKNSNTYQLSKKNIQENVLQQQILFTNEEDKWVLTKEEILDDRLFGIDVKIPAIKETRLFNFLD